MDDARVTLDVILSAEEHGAHVLNYCEAISFQEIPDGNIKAVQVRDILENKEFKIKSRIIVLACGHWTDRVIRIVNPDAKSRIRPTKGIHIVTKRFYNYDYALGLPIRDGRLFFVLPFGKYNLIGTTDTDYTEDYDDVPVRGQDVEYLIEAINYLFPSKIQFICYCWWKIYNISSNG